MGEEGKGKGKKRVEKNEGLLSFLRLWLKNCNISFPFS